MSGNIVSAITNIEYLDDIGYQVNFPTTALGTFSVQVCMDYNSVTGTANWNDYPFTTTPTADGVLTSIYLDMPLLSAPWIRLIYTRTSGTGTLNAFICGKQT